MYCTGKLNGKDGKDGSKGVKGDTGAQGIQGPKGDKGDKGDSGIMIDGTKTITGDDIVTLLGTKPEIVLPDSDIIGRAFYEVNK